MQATADRVPARTGGLGGPGGLGGCGQTGLTNVSIRASTPGVARGRRALSERNQRQLCGGDVLRVAGEPQERAQGKCVCVGACVCVCLCVCEPYCVFSSVCQWSPRLSIQKLIHHY